MASRSSFTFALICVVLLLIGLAVVGGVSFIAGGIVGQEQLYSTWRQRKLDKLAVILQTPEFSGVRAEHSSADQVYLTGTLHDLDARQDLLARLIDAFGADEAARMLALVDDGT